MNYLIVGLGNIGGEYENTRHNVGFDIVDYLAQKHDCTFKLERLAYQAEFRFKGRKFQMIKPTTYMNLSGKAVRYWMQMKKIRRENILVLVDDKDLPFGKLRLRGKGSDGGHNGLKDITSVLNTGQYARLRFGIGNNFAKGQQARYVLGKWTSEEAEKLPALIEKSAQATLSFATLGLSRTMNLFN